MIADQGWTGFCLCFGITGICTFFDNAALAKILARFNNEPGAADLNVNHLQLKVMKLVLGCLALLSFE